MKRLFVMIIGFFYCSFLLGCSSTMDNELSSWVGEYFWGDTYAAAQPGGTNLTEQYVILIYEEGNTYFADFSADGWMLGIRAKAEVYGNKEQIALIFLKYASDTYQQPFTEKDEILSFSRDGSEIITKWITGGPHFGAEIERKEFTLANDKYQ